MNYLVMEAHLESEELGGLFNLIQREHSPSGCVRGVPHRDGSEGRRPVSCWIRVRVPPMDTDALKKLRAKGKYEKRAPKNQGQADPPAGARTFLDGAGSSRA